MKKNVSLAGTCCRGDRSFGVEEAAGLLLVIGYDLRPELDR